MTETAMRAAAIDPYLPRAMDLCRGNHEAVPACAAYLRQKDFMAAIQPWQELKLQIYATATLKMIVHPDGRMESSHDFAPEMQKILEECDRRIQEEAVRYGLPHQERVEHE